MNNGLSHQLYIANMGMITAIGPSATSTYYAVAAGISGYQRTDQRSKNGEPITMALVPPALFDEFAFEVEECNPYHAQFDHRIKMAIITAIDACKDQPITQPIPLMLAMPEPESGPVMPHGLLTDNLAAHCGPAISPELTRSFHTGRAAGIEAIEFAFHRLSGNPLILIGASDSHIHPSQIKTLDEANRLLTIQSPDSFAAGEGACFLLLTSDPQLAMVKNNCMIALHPPGVAEETGHMHSEEAYRGDGLDQAFKTALKNQAEQSIDAIYSSMNGENFWAKEYGVAYLRNKPKFKDPVRTEHPADCYGDLGSATAPALIAIAAENLWNNKSQYKHLVYSSSDTAKRGAIVIEKIPAKIANI
ncbi:MAG TPA: hypothetical protein VLC79_05050 [Cellvibrio sp.]|nr:hypothetical protein [Cellvibrio sp.]